jgi:hypothetical protein
MNNEKLNELLKKHQAATLRSSSPDDPLKDELRKLKLVDQRRAAQTVQPDKKLGKMKMLLPPPKV